MKKRCSPQGIVNAVGFPILCAVIATPVLWIILSVFTKNNPQSKDDRFALIAYIVIIVLFLTMIAGAGLNLGIRLRRAFGHVEISESGVEERSRRNVHCLSWDDIGWIFVLPSISTNLRTGAILEQRICFARKKRELTLAERLNILSVEDIISFPYSLDAEVYVRHHTDTVIDFEYMEDNRIPADIARDENAKERHSQMR